MAAEEKELDVKETQANNIIKNNVLWALGAGLIPFPVVDIAAVTGVQLKMLNQLSKLWDTKFSENWGKSTIASLIGGFGSGSIARGTLGSLTKAIPVVGPLAATATMPAVSGAATYAIGKVFVQHFASGGTFLNFDPAKVKEYYAEMFKEGTKMASGLKKESETKEH